MPEGAPSNKSQRLNRAWTAFLSDQAAVVSLIYLSIVTLLCLAAPYIATFDPYEAANSMRNKPPGTGEFLLGTDNGGRDLVARLLYGGRTSLIVGIVPTFVAMIIGLLLGLPAGVFRGWTDQITMRLLDTLFAFPTVLLAIAIAGVLEPGLLTEILAITVVLVPYIARVVRNSTITVMGMPYIEAAKGCGARQRDIIFSYVLPNMISPVIVYTTTLVGIIIVIGAGLSFLGLGVSPPEPDWGTMVAEGRVVLQRAPHITLLPGFMIISVSLAFNFIGDGLRDAFDPKSVRL